MMKTISIALVMFVAAACSKSKGDPCDATAIASISNGKQLALTGCTFKGQGNDVVAFGDATGHGNIDCKMKGGENAVTEFRHSAMKVGMSKLKLDVQGTGDSGALKDCEITAHE